VFEVV